ncbi:MAG: ATP-binding protein [Planctomycetota bacterium]|nr:ATP-binding protein [Planctomycetota bacterium]
MAEAVHRELIVPSDTAYLAQVRKAVLDVLGRSVFQPSVVHLISLAVDEAVANVMEHAYSHSGERVKKEIQIVLDADPERFEILIRDSGQRFDPAILPDVDIREHVRKGKKGGLGVFLMRKIMDEVNYSFKQGTHNELQMIKYVDNRG